jgi:hypothetical protein
VGVGRPRPCGGRSAHRHGRRFPPRWSVEDADTKLGQDRFIVRDADVRALAYEYFKDESGRRSAANLLTSLGASLRAISRELLLAACEPEGWVEKCGKCPKHAAV